MTVGYLAAEGFEQQLDDELAFAGARITTRHGRLLLTDELVDAAWAANIWFDVESIAVSSIGAAARALRDRQRNWAAYAPVHRGRVALVTERLPHVSAKPLPLGAPAPPAPLGSWTLLTPDLVLASARCASPFPNGEVRFVEPPDEPPSRAYLKLWEAFVRVGRWPGRGDRCLDLGASPGGWTWTLAQLGAQVTAIDRAPLDPRVDRLANVEWRGESAFGLEPSSVGPVDWLCCDVIAYPARLLTLAERWLRSGLVRNLVMTVKFQGETDHATARAFASIPMSQLFHLHHNRHELTFVVLDADAAPVADG